MDNTEIATVLEAAADLYEAEKIEWCQGQWLERQIDDDGKKVFTMCAEGALMRAAGFNWNEVDQLSGDMITEYTPQVPRTQRAKALFEGAQEALVKVIEEGHDQVNVIGFNDTHGRTKDEVIDLFKTTAKDLRNVGDSVL